MRKLSMIAILAGLFAFSFSSCRDQKTQKEEVIEEMRDKGADIDVKDDGDKIKMETENEEVKIKTDDDGDVKIKRETKD